MNPWAKVLNTELKPPSENIDSHSSFRHDDFRQDEGSGKYKFEQPFIIRNTFVVWKKRVRISVNHLLFEKTC